MEDISRRSRLSDNTPTITELVVQILAYNVITELGDNVLIGEGVDNTYGNLYTRKFINHLKSVTGDLPGKASPVSPEYYTKEYQSLIKSTSSDT